jgi:hypothetical protein
MAVAALPKRIECSVVMDKSRFSSLRENVAKGLCIVLYELFHCQFSSSGRRNMKVCDEDGASVFLGILLFHDCTACV